MFTLLYILLIMLVMYRVAKKVTPYRILLIFGSKVRIFKSKFFWLKGNSGRVLLFIGPPCTYYSLYSCTSVDLHYINFTQVMLF